MSSLLPSRPNRAQAYLMNMVGGRRLFYCYDGRSPTDTRCGNVECVKTSELVSQRTESVHEPVHTFLLPPKPALLRVQVGQQQKDCFEIRL